MAQQSLVFAGSVLPDNAFLTECGVTNGSTLRLVLKVRSALTNVVTAQEAAATTDLVPEWIDLNEMDVLDVTGMEDWERDELLGVLFGEDATPSRALVVCRDGESISVFQVQPSSPDGSSPDGSSFRNSNQQLAASQQDYIHRLSLTQRLRRLQENARHRVRMADLRSKMKDKQAQRTKRQTGRGSQVRSRRSRERSARSASRRSPRASAGRRKPAPPPGPPTNGGPSHKAPKRASRVREVRDNDSTNTGSPAVDESENVGRQSDQRNLLGTPLSPQTSRCTEQRRRLKSAPARVAPRTPSRLREMQRADQPRQPLQPVQPHKYQPAPPQAPRDPQHHRRVHNARHPLGLQKNNHLPNHSHIDQQCNHHHAHNHVPSNRHKGTVSSGMRLPALGQPGKSARQSTPPHLRMG